MKHCHSTQNHFTSLKSCFRSQNHQQNPKLVGLNFSPEFPYLWMNVTLPILLLIFKRMLPTVENYY